MSFAFVGGISEQNIQNYYCSFDFNNTQEYAFSLFCPLLPLLYW